MGLPASQRRILERIENALRGSDPRLAALFSIFSRLNRDEEMPAHNPKVASSASHFARRRLPAVIVVPIDANGKRYGCVGA